MGASTALFDVGYSPRHLWFILSPNIDPNNVRPQPSADEQTALEFVLAVAGRSFIATGVWTKAEEEEEDRTAKFFGGSDKIVPLQNLSNLKKAKLMFFLHDFKPDYLGEQICEQYREAEDVANSNKQAEYERNAAAARGKAVPPQWEDDEEFEARDDGTGVQLPNAFLNKKIMRMRALKCIEGSAAHAAFLAANLKITAKNDELADDTDEKIMFGKALGIFVRVVGVLELINIAVMDVARILGERALKSTLDNLYFLINVGKR